MPDASADRNEELCDIIEQKLTGLVREMEDADWSAEEVALAISDVLKNKWLNQIMALRDAREAVSEDFLSDGNEG